MDEELKALVQEMLDAGEDDAKIEQVVQLYENQQAASKIPYQSEALASGMHRSPGAVAAGVGLSALPAISAISPMVGSLLSHPIADAAVGAVTGYMHGGLKGAATGGATGWAGGRLGRLFFGGRTPTKPPVPTAPVNNTGGRLITTTHPSRQMGANKTQHPAIGPSAEDAIAQELQLGQKSPRAFQSGDPEIHELGPSAPGIPRSGLDPKLSRIADDLKEVARTNPKAAQEAVGNLVRRRVLLPDEAQVVANELRIAELTGSQRGTLSSAGGRELGWPEKVR